MNVQELRREALERDRRELLLAQASQELAGLRTEDLVDVVTQIRVRRSDERRSPTRKGDQ